jgi:hypothetical protein
MTSFPIKILEDSEGNQQLGDSPLVDLCSERDMCSGNDLLALEARLAHPVRTEVLVGTRPREGGNDTIAELCLQTR